MRRSVFILVYLLFSTLPSMAAKWDDAIVAFDAERYEDVLKLLASEAKPDMAPYDMDLPPGPCLAP